MRLLAAAVALSLLAAGWAAYPLVARRGAVLRDAAPGALLEAEAERRAALGALREAEYDFVAGKLDAEDYAALRERIGREALVAIRAAERAAGAQPRRAEATPAHRCGFANPPASRFCAGCGARLG